MDKLHNKLNFSAPDIKLSSDELEDIGKIINSGWFCEGQYVEALEKYFITEYNVKYAIPCANCTSGLVIALKAAGINERVVGIPAFTWPSTLYALECNNCTPMFCDIHPDTWCIDLNNTSKFLSVPETILPVDCFGVPAEIYKDTSLPVVYDAAHSYGSEWLGSRGDIEVVSFSFTKVVTGMQGGIILTNDLKFAVEIRELVRLSSKMLEISAYLILKGIKEYDSKLERKKNTVCKYKELIKVKYTTQNVPSNWNHSVFSILLETPEATNRVAAEFYKNNIEVKRYYVPLVHSDKYLNVTKDVYSRILALPLHYKAENRIEEICNIINNFGE